MTPDLLERRLRELPVPDSRTGLAQSVAEARAEIAARPEPAPRERAWPRRALALAAVALALVVALLSPPGRAASAWVGELVGIGDVGGEPTLEPGGFRTPGTGVVVANGSAPDGSRYEWVAYRCKVDDQDLGAGFRGVGLSLDWPGVKGREAGGHCEEGAGDEGRGVFRSFGVHILPSQFRGFDRPDLVISGSTGPAVHRVSVVYVEPDGRERELDVDFARVEGKLRRLASRSVPLGTFVAFLPGEIAARDEVEARLDLRAMESTGKLEVGPIARRELAQAAQARTACESEYPDNAALAELARLPLRSAADGRRRGEAFKRVFAPHSQCLLSQMPRGPFEYVAYDAEGRVLDRFREPLILPATAPREPAGREPAGEVRLPYPPVPGAGRPVVLVSGRAPDGALFELYTQEMDGDVCINLFWPYVFEEGASGACGPGLPPPGAFGRRHPERVAARGYGFLNDAAAATRHSVMTGFARANVARVEVTYEDSDGRRHEAPVTLGHSDEGFGMWVTFGPRSAGRRPWLEVVAYDGQGRELSRERQRG